MTAKRAQSRRAGKESGAVAATEARWPADTVERRPVAALILLRQKFERLYFVIGAQQQGHRGKLATRASINRRRMVAMEFGM